MVVSREAKEEVREYFTRTNLAKIKNASLQHLRFITPDNKRS